MAFPALYLLFAALLFDIPLNQCLRLLLSPSYYLLSLLAMLAGYGLWEMRRWAWYLFLATNIFMVYGNAVLVSNYGESHNRVLAFIFSVVVVIALIYRMAREIRVPYFFPKIRWWESNPRYRLVVPTSVRRDSGESFAAEILDLSMGGCFVKLRNDLGEHEALALEFSIFGQPVKALGTVVWRTQSTVTHPKGVGVKFGPLPRIERRTLRAINIRLKKMTAFYRSSRYLISPEEFFKRYQSLQTEQLVVSRKERRQAAIENDDAASEE
jgi:hypothetical protein